MNMIRRDARRSPDFAPILLMLGALCLAVLLGLMTSYLPLGYTVLLVLIPIVLVAGISRPDLGLIIALMLIFEVVPSNVQPRVPFSGGRLEAYDVLLIYLGAVVLLRAWVARGRPLESMGPIRWSLYYLLACMVTSMVYVHYFAPNQMMLAEARVAIAWLVVPLIALSANTQVRYRWLVRAVVAIGLVIALYVTIQSLFNVRIMTGARVEQLDQEANGDIVRSIAGGGIYVVIFALFLIINRMLERRLSWLWGTAASLLLVAGLAVQFGRGVWVAAAAGLIISAAIFRGVAGILRVVTVGILVISLVVGAAAIFKPRMAEALLARAVGIGAEIESGGSYGWRKAENSAAMARLERSPLTGTGLGGDYKQTFSAEGSFKIETSYIHNAYLYFPLKMGLLATLIPLAFVVAFVVTIRQGQLRHRGPTADPALVAALCGAFAVPVITSYTQPEWVNPLGIAAFAVLMGLALLYRQMGTPLAVAGASPR